MAGRVRPAVPPACLVTSPDAAVAASESIGYPVVLKAQAAALPHKSEQGVLALRPHLSG